MLYLLVCMCAKSLQSRLILCNNMGCSLPGSSVHGILQARILEWTAISSSRGSSQRRDPASLMSLALAVSSLPWAPPWEARSISLLELILL